MKKYPARMSLRRNQRISFQKFGGNVKVVSPVVQPLEAETEDPGELVRKSKPIDFDLKPED